MDNYPLTYQAPEMTTKEILDVFMPECMIVIKRNISILKKQIKLYKPMCDRALDMTLEQFYRDRTPNIARDRLWVSIANWYFYLPYTTAIERLEKCEKLLLVSKFGEQTHSTINLQKAKAVPLTMFLKVNHAHFATCPFHLDKTPSLKVDRHNRFHCFSCGFNGDVIDFYMKQNGVDFKTAVYDLNKY